MDIRDAVQPEMQSFPFGQSVLVSQVDDEDPL